MTKYIGFLLAFFLLPVVPAYAVTYATWNAADKNANITLSGGNLTASHDAGNAGAWEGVRSTIGKTSGKWYWELTFAGQPRMSAVANTSASLTNFFGGDANGWGYYGGDGQKYTGGTGSAYGSTYVVGDVIGVALNMDAGTVTFYKNGVSQGQAFSGLTGTIYAGGTTDTSSASFTANFGATAFAQTVPTGFCQGLSDTCVGGSSTSSFNFWQFFDF